MSKLEDSERRDVASRNTKWAQSFAHWLAKRSITPNQISVMSTLFSAIGGGALIFSCFSDLSFYISLIIFIIGIQMRLLCNLFDGMVAVEGGKKTPNGDLYNDIPDRFSDMFLIIPVGYVAQGYGIELGWLAAILAIMTAYIRWVGAYKTQKHFFNGPMAKQHRMALLTFASVVGLCALHTTYFSQVFLISLIILNLGLIVTLIRRLYFISHIELDK